MDQSQVDQSWDMGVADGIASAQSGAEAVQTLTQFYALKKKNDESVRGVSYDSFVALKQNGTVGDYNLA